MTIRILIISAMLASFAMLPTESEAQQPQKPKPAAPQAAPKGTPAPQAAPPAAGAAVDQTQSQTPPVDEATRKRQAALERAKERKREQQEREAQCVIKPVMSDEDIAKCRAVRGG